VRYIGPCKLGHRVLGQGGSLSCACFMVELQQFVFGLPSARSAACAHFPGLCGYSRMDFLSFGLGPRGASRRQVRPPPLRLQCRNAGPAYSAPDGQFALGARLSAAQPRGSRKSFRWDVGLEENWERVPGHTAAEHPSRAPSRVGVLSRDRGRLCFGSSAPASRFRRRARAKAAPAIRRSTLARRTGHAGAAWARGACSGRERKILHVAGTNVARWARDHPTVSPRPPVSAARPTGRSCGSRLSRIAGQAWPWRKWLAPSWAARCGRPALGARRSKQIDQTGGLAAAVRAGTNADNGPRGAMRYGKEEERRLAIGPARHRIGNADRLSMMSEAGRSAGRAPRGGEVLGVVGGGPPAVLASRLSAQ